MLRHADRGSVLLLFPAAFMAMLVLGAIVLDTGLVHVRARELQAVASSAANDTLAALDEGALRDRGVVELEVDVIRRLTLEAIAAGPLPGAQLDDIDVHRDASGRLEVAITLRLEERLVLAPALPGAPRTVTITRTGTAVILE